MTENNVERMHQTVNMLPLHDAITYVSLRRHDVPEAYGIHLLYESSGWPAHTTLGLFKADEAGETLRAFVEDYGVTGLIGVFSQHPKSLQEYIRRQVIPLEWKSQDDAYLDERVSITYGRVRHYDSMDVTMSRMRTLAHEVVDQAEEV